MTYSPSEYEQAKRELEERRSDAEKQQKLRHDEISQKHPELLLIEQEMANAGLSAIKALGMGNDATSYIKMLEKASLSAQAKRKALLLENGYSEDYLKVKYHCPICEDKGFKNGKMCTCHKLILRKNAYRKLSGNFPVDKCTFLNFNLDYYSNEGEISPKKRMSAVYDYCKKYADNFTSKSSSLLMFGKTGLGKTHLSLAIAGKVINRGYGVIYASAQNILNKLENEKFGRSDTFTTEKKLIECDLLILDDLGTEFTTQFTVSAIYNIINSRLLSNKPTIISTNLSADEIEKRYELRVSSRILNEYTHLQFDGTDVRQLKTR